MNATSEISTTKAILFSRELNHQKTHMKIYRMFELNEIVFKLHCVMKVHFVCGAEFLNGINLFRINCTRVNTFNTYIYSLVYVFNILDT